jgi:DNA polymerase elongation subunit (family B)
MRVDYIPEDIPKILLFGRDKNRKLYTLEIPFRAYFYVDNSNIINDDLVEYDGDYKSFFGDNIKKVFVKTGKNLTDVMDNLRSKFKDTYEAHIFLKNRFLIDSGIKSNFLYDEVNKTITPIDKPSFYVPPRIIYFDIETNLKTQNIREEVKKADGEIISISFYDNYRPNEIMCFLYHPEISGIQVKNIRIKYKFNNNDKERFFKLYIIRYNNEIKMLNDFINIFIDRDFDIVTGYNIAGIYKKGIYLEGFDLPYLINRCKKLGVNINKISPINIIAITDKGILFRGREVVDLQYALEDLQKSYADLISWKLDNVADYYLNIKPSGINVIEEWRNKNFVNVIKKNVTDVIKTVLLDEEIGVIEYLDDRRRLIGCSFEDLQFHSRLITILLLREKINPIPDKPRIPSELKKYKTYKGAFVLEPPIGLNENIAVYDFRMAYPSVITALNISPDTITNGNGYKINAILIGKDEKEYEETTYFSRDKKGILPIIVSKLKEKRNETKEKLKNCKPEEYRIYKMKDQNMKFLINSIYGVIGLKTFPLYNPLVAGSVTSAVREIIQAVKDGLENMGYTVLYIDTDSLFVKTKNLDEAKQLENTINDIIKTFMTLRWNCNEYLTMEFQDFYKTILFLPKEKGEEEEGAKKNIVGLNYNNELNTVGIIGRETAYPQITVNAQKTLLKMMLIEKKSKEEIINYIKTLIANFDKFTLEQIGIPRAYNKPFDEYERKTPVVRGLEYAHTIFGHPIPVLGTKLKYVWVWDIKGFPATNVIAWEDIKYIPADKVIINKDLMIDVCLRKGLERILKAYGIEWKKYFPVYKKSIKERMKDEYKKAKLLDYYFYGK